MSNLTIHLFGTPRVVRDGMPLLFDTRKAVALLAYLAVTARHHSRDELADFFWPDSPDPRAALRRTLSVLNAQLGDWLIIEREQIAIHLPAIDVDVHQFRQQLQRVTTHPHTAQVNCSECHMLLQQAVQHYRGAFLAGFSLRDSPAFDEWQLLEAEALQRELRTSFTQLIQIETAQQAFETAIGYARQRLALDPLDETGHQTLMQLLFQNGQRHAALQHYQVCVRILEQELGVVPLEETTELYNTIKSQRTLVALQPIPDKLPATLTEQPSATNRSHFVGRTVALAALEQHYTAATHGQLVALTGEAGIGKTRLAEEFLARVRARNATVLSVRCYASEQSLAYAVAAALLQAVLSVLPDWQTRIEEPWRSDLAQLLPERTTHKPATIDTPGAQIRLFEAILRVLQQSFQPNYTSVLLIDDVQWADQASLDLLFYLVHRLPNRSLLMLVTWRDSDAVTHTMLKRFLAETRRAGYGAEIQLERFNRSDLDDLVHGWQSHPTFLDRLYHETEGLPFFLVEYLKAWQTGLIQPNDTPWQMPGGVTDLLHSRLQNLSETAQQVLTAAAVIGRSFEYEILRAVSGRNEDETLTAIEELLQQSLIAELRSDGTRYDFSHARMRDLVYAESSTIRRRLLHKRVAAELVNKARTRSAIAQAAHIAQHYEHAGDHAEAATWYQRAGDQARGLYANSAALAHYQAALRLEHPDQTQLLHAIGDLYTLRGMYEAALSSYATACAITQGMQLAMIQRTIAAVHMRRSEWAHAEHYLKLALAHYSAQNIFSQHAAILAELSMVTHRCGDTAHALDLAQQARALAEQTKEAQSLAQVHNVLGILAGATQLVTAAHHFMQSLHHATAIGDLAAQATALHNLAHAQHANGDSLTALASAQQALAHCTTQGDTHRAAAVHNTLADLHYSLGQRDAAMQHQRQSVALFAEVGAGELRPEIWMLTEW